MLYLIDTNVCAMYLNGRSASISDRILSIPTQDIAVCSVVKAELFYGAMKSNNPARTLQRQKAFFDHYQSLPFDDQAAAIFGNIRAQLTTQGTPIGAYDLQIAAIALAHNLILVTHNAREFSRITELKLEDWEI